MCYYVGLLECYFEYVSSRIFDHSVEIEPLTICSNTVFTNALLFPTKNLDHRITLCSPLHISRLILLSVCFYHSTADLNAP